MSTDSLRDLAAPAPPWSALLAARELLWTLALREIKVRYRQAALGAAWAVLQPLSLMVVFTVFFSLFLRVPSDGIPYPLFAYTALLPWSFFAGALAAAIPSLTANASLITKVYFPRAVLPLAAILAAGVDFGVAAVLFVGLLLLYRVPLTPHLLYVPLLLGVQLACTVGIALFLAALNVRFRDVRHALPLLLQLWMFATPIIYPLSVIPERFRSLYLLNPMAGIIDGYRRAALQGLPPDLKALGLAALVSAVLLAASCGYFKRAERTFADVI